MSGEGRSRLQRLSVTAAADEAPDRIALISDDRAYTYSELADLVAGAASRLSARFAMGGAGSGKSPPGIGPPVAVVAERTLETVCVLLALFESGVPAVVLHEGLTVAERDALLRLCSPVLTVDGDLATVLTRGAGPQLPDEGSPPPSSIDPESILAVVPTSGSAGRPKTVLLSRRAFLTSADASAANLGWEENDRWLVALPLAHVGGLCILVRTLVARSCAVLNPPGFDPVQTIETIRRHEITLMSLVPAMLAELLETRLAWRPPERLRAVLLGGAAADPSLLERAADRGIPVLTTYGLTEACSQVTTQRYGTVNRGEMGAGAPPEGVELRLMDGEIQLRGPTLMSGYMDSGGLRSGLDAEGWLSTSDEGELDEAGQLHLHGRLDRLIVTGGENVDPLEVEAALVTLGPIREAVVFGVEDPKWGRVVAAALVAEDDALALAADDERELDSLRDRLWEMLAPHKRPRLIGFLNALPLTPSGKPDRAAAEAAVREELRPL